MDYLKTYKVFESFKDLDNDIKKILNTERKWWKLKKEFSEKYKDRILDSINKIFRLFTEDEMEEIYINGFPNFLQNCDTVEDKGSMEELFYDGVTINDQAPCDLDLQTPSLTANRGAQPYRYRISHGYQCDEWDYLDQLESTSLYMLLGLLMNIKFVVERLNKSAFDAMNESIEDTRSACPE